MTEFNVGDTVSFEGVVTVPTDYDGPLVLTRTRPDDPAYALLQDPNIFSTPTVYRDNCYICRDPEFAQMGLPLCKYCEGCETGHVPADDVICDDCGADAQELWQDKREAECVENGHNWKKYPARTYDLTSRSKLVEGEWVTMPHTDPAYTRCDNCGVKQE